MQIKKKKSVIFVNMIHIESPVQNLIRNELMRSISLDYTAISLDGVFDKNRAYLNQMKQVKCGIKDH